MKYSYVFVLLLIAANAAPTVDPVTDIKQFILGFLRGLVQDGENDFKDVMVCVEELIAPATYQQLWTDISNAVQDLKHIDLLHWDSIKKALLELFNSVYDIIGIVKPCLNSVKEIQNIISLLSSLNPIALLEKAGKNIIFHGGKLLSDLIDIYSQYQKGNWTNMGYDLADFIYNLLLKSPLPTTSVSDDSTGYLILKGILEGIASEGYDVTDILSCISDFSTLETDFNEMITELNEIIAKIKLRDIFKVIHALKYVFDDLKNMFDIIESCGKSIDGNIQKIIDVFKDMDIGKLVEKFALNLIKHFGTVFTDITQAISNYKAGSYEVSGQFIGKALYEVLLS